MKGEEWGREREADLCISVARSAARDLEDLAPGWDDLYPDEQTDFELEWLNDMSYLRRAERMRVAGELTEEQERAYEPVRHHITGLLPTIRRLGLPEPEVPLD